MISAVAPAYSIPPTGIGMAFDLVDLKYAVEVQRSLDGVTWEAMTIILPWTATGLPYFDPQPLDGVNRFYRCRLTDGGSRTGAWVAVTPTKGKPTSLRVTSSALTSVISAVDTPGAITDFVSAQPVAAAQIPLVTGTVSSAAPAVADGTAAALVNTNPGLSGSPGSAPTDAPNVTPIYNGNIIDMSAFPLPSANSVYVLDYSVNGGAYTSGAFLATGPKLIHAFLNPANTYAYKFKIRAASDTAYSAASAAFNPSSRADVVPFGIIVASMIFSVTLSAIVADIGIIVAGRMDNAAASPTAGIRLSAGYSKPGTWTRYLDLAASGANPFLKHELLSLNADGTASFSGSIILDGGLGNFSGNDPGVAHGITGVAPTNTWFYLFETEDNVGGVTLLALVDTNDKAAVSLSGIVQNDSTTVPVMQFTVFKKNGTTTQALGATAIGFQWASDTTVYARMFGTARLEQYGAVLCYPGTATTLGRVPILVDSTNFNPGISSGAGTLDTLETITVKANTLSQNGNVVDIVFWAFCNGINCTMKLKFGSVTVATKNMIASTSNLIHCTVTRLGSGSQYAESLKVDGNGTVTIEHATPAQTDTSDITVLFQGQDNGVGANVSLTGAYITAYTLP